MRKGNVPYEELGKLLIFDKRFQGLPKGYQEEIASYKHVSAELLKGLSVEGGDIRLISTGLFDGFTTKELAQDYINNGEIIAIPTGGTANIKYYKGVFVDSGNILATTNRKDVNLKYVYYFLLANQQQVNSFYRGVSIKHPYMPDICKMLIPFPSIREQERIVCEFDGLFDIAEKQEQQVALFDDLLMSYFWELFGNPKTNEKNWNRIKWCDAFDTILGKMLDKNKQNPEDLLLPYLANVNVRWGSFDLEHLKEMTFRPKEVEKLSLKKGDLMLCEGGEAGRCAVWSDDTKRILFQKAIHRARRKRNDVSPYFVQYYIRILRALGGLKDYISKATIEHLTGDKLRTLPIILPPYELQCKFEQAVLSVNRQEELIKQSIVATETLISSRMSFFFKA